MTPTITVHHVKEPLDPAKLNLYCGRGNAPAGMVNTRLGNPFVMRNQSEDERHRVCDAYREMLLADHQHIHWPVIRHMGQRLHEGHSLRLYCYCAPKRCHCNEIATFALIAKDAIEAGILPD